MKKIAFLLSSLWLLQGCVPVAIASAGSAGADLGMQDRTVGNAIDDISIKTAISGKFFNKDVNDLFKNVEVNVIEGRVFLTGDVLNPQTEIEAVRLAWQVKGVREVVNELQVEDKTSITDYVRDAWIQRQIGTQLLFTKGIRSTNYTLECVNNVVYLFGLAHDEEELRKVTSIASRTKYVKEVVSHVVLKHDPRRN
jgi:osmotically-inducible protein OsmY